ncbi:MAG: four helix bundle protein [Bacteroidales bacterium]|jgi:four helix bundle protein|nr:four helix bundle protein [Bacteroidales bacterium]
MFDFKKLIVYQKARDFALTTTELLANNKFDKAVNDQLRRASLSIMLNIAEGSSRFSNKDRKNFMVVARGSAFECSAIFDFLHASKLISTEVQLSLDNQLEEISKMLYALIEKLDK